MTTSWQNVLLAGQGGYHKILFCSTQRLKERQTAHFKVQFPLYRLRRCVALYSVVLYSGQRKGLAQCFVLLLYQQLDNTDRAETHVALVQTHSYYICWCGLVGKDQKYHPVLASGCRTYSHRLCDKDQLRFTRAEIGCCARLSFESAFIASHAGAAAKARMKSLNSLGRKRRRLIHISGSSLVVQFLMHVFNCNGCKFKRVLSATENRTTKNANPPAVFI